MILVTYYLQKQIMKINLGIAPIAWSNDDMPELGGDTPIETCLEEALSLIHI